ncbi:MAG: hypothetical protein IPK22_15045 [Verrucomicrobiaceae bacterium]|nr:hypothetical protein [Verrucomicrobiaceae bacterium]
MPLRLIFALFTLSGLLHAHNVPSMTIESRFKENGNFDLTINFDPRACLAADPRTLPPVAGSWFSDQSPEQAAATLEKARDYLRQSVGLIFNGRPIPLPELTLQPIDGADNTPLKPDTQELHLLAKCAAPVPDGATEFQITFAKTAAIDLILLNALEGTTERRPQVLFPGETSRPFVFRTSPPPPPVAAAAPERSTISIILFFITATAVFIGWRLLSKYRHFHRGHKKPGDRKPE